MNSDFEATLSLERFSRYLGWAAGDRDRALDLYALNTRLSEVLYTPLQVLEVTLRNRVHVVLTEARHDRWFDDDGFLLVKNQISQLAKAREDVYYKSKEPTPGDIVAALTFSFWTSMLAPAYEVLWRTTLNRIACREDGKSLSRKALSRPLQAIRHLRNRVAHHEPILQWDLGKRYADILQLTGWLSPAAASWCESHSRFREVWPAERIALHE